MVVQYLYLSRVDWECVVFYGAKATDAVVILKELENLGCKGETLENARINLLSSTMNHGLTFSRYSKRKSVMVIGEASSPKEFSNTYNHEKGHLASHIADALNIEPMSEDYQYLTGDIAEETWYVFASFVCGCH